MATPPNERERSLRAELFGSDTEDDDDSGDAASAEVVRRAAEAVRGANEPVAAAGEAQQEAVRDDSEALMIDDGTEVVRDVGGIPGLCMVRGFLSSDLQHEVLAHIREAGWFPNDAFGSRDDDGRDCEGSTIVAAARNSDVNTRSVDSGAVVATVSEDGGQRKRLRKEDCNSDGDSLPARAQAASSSESSKCVEASGAVIPPQTDINQVMIARSLPTWSSLLLDQLEGIEHLLLPCAPGAALARRPLFDQMITNAYAPGQGISSHVDIPHRYNDGIVGFSLLSSCLMTFRRCSQGAAGGGRLGAAEPVVDVLLRPGDLLAMSGEARWHWEHGIEARLYDDVQCQCCDPASHGSSMLGAGAASSAAQQHTVRLFRKHRISVTFRHLTFL